MTGKKKTTPAASKSKAAAGALHSQAAQPET